MSLAHLVIVSKDGASSNPTWWIPLLAAFGGALLGASIGGWLTYRQRLRRSRASLYELSLYDFHDEVAHRRAAVEAGSAPMWTGRRGLLVADAPDLGQMFSAFDRDAATASSFDVRTVRAIWPRLERINAVSSECETERRRSDHQRQRDPDSTPTDDDILLRFGNEQLALWQELDRYLWQYRFWLEWKATKHFVTLSRPRKGLPSPATVEKPPRFMVRRGFPATPTGQTPD